MRPNQVCFKAILVIILTMSLSVTGFCRIFGNGSGNGFDEKSGSKDEINLLIIDGASSYLKAYTNVLLSLDKIELSDIEGINFSEVSNDLFNARKNLNSAIISYNRLIFLAENSTLRLTVFKKLKELNYEKLAKEKKLNNLMINEINNFLANGDLAGIYRSLKADFTDIDLLLEKIEQTVKNHKMPSNTHLWKLNRKFAKTLLRGQYIAEIFHTIK